MGSPHPSLELGHPVSVTYVVVSGLAGSGKSQVARPLAQQLGTPSLVKDPIKEALWDAVAGALDTDRLELSRQVGRAANEVLVSVAGAASAGVLDSLWHPDWALDALDGLGDEWIEVFCKCPLPEAHRRYTERKRHPAHPDGQRAQDPELWSEDRNQPLRPGAVIVDTTRPADVERLATEIRAHPAWDPVPPHLPPVVIVLSGLPATGKSTIGAALSRETGAPVVAHDITQAALLRSGLDTRDRSITPAYAVLGALAREQLSLGHPVILDSVVGRDEQREEWRALAAEFGAAFIAIECVCSDESMHRERLRGRRRDIPGWYEPDWAEVETVRARFDRWTLHRLVVDAADPLDQNIAAAVEHVVDATGPAPPTAPARRRPSSEDAAR